METWQFRVVVILNLFLTLFVQQKNLARGTSKVFIDSKARQKELA